MSIPDGYDFRGPGLNLAIYGPGERYRYTLWRSIGGGSLGLCVFVMLNPSTATDFVVDPTTRRCVDFARRWGYSEYAAVNLFAYRATKPRDMKAVKDPVGPLNNKYVLAVVEKAEFVVAAWGNHGSYRGRSKEVLELLEGHQLNILKLTKQGEPHFPLYLPRDTKPFEWTPTIQNRARGKGSEQC